MLKSPINILEGVEKGMTSSPYAGFAQLRGVDPHRIPGALTVERAFTKVSETPVASQNFTGDATSNQLTLTNGLTDRQPFILTGSDLPDPLAAATIYFAIRVDATHIKVATTYANAVAGTFVDINDAGSGTMTIATVNLSLPKWTITADGQGLYFLDSAGRLWGYDGSWADGVIHLLPGNTLGLGEGLTYWKNYVIVARTSSTNIVLSFRNVDTGAWSASEITFTGGNPIASPGASTRTPCLVGQDDIVYVCAGNYVNSLSEVAGQTFDPTSGATYTASVKALDLPQDVNISCLEELGKYLEMGTKYGVDTGTSKLADMFPWDRTSDSFDLAVRFGDEGVNAVITDRNLVYASCGREGKIYVTNGSSVQDFAQAPLDTRSGSGFLLDVGSDSLELLGKELVVGIQQGTTDSTEGPIGIFGIKDGAWRFFGNLSFDNDGAGGRIQIGTIYSTNPETLYVGWQYGTTVGIDKLAPTNYRRTTGAYIESPMYQVAMANQKEAIEAFDFNLGRDLATGQSVVLKYRRSVNDSWTTCATFSYATHGAINSTTIVSVIPLVTTIQFRAELTCAASSTASPEVRAIIAR